MLVNFFCFFGFITWRIELDKTMKKNILHFIIWVMQLVFFFFFFFWVYHTKDSIRIWNSNLSFSQFHLLLLLLKKSEYCILLLKWRYNEKKKKRIYKGSLIYIYILSNLNKPIHQLKHFKVDQASLAHNHKFFITIRIQFITVPMFHFRFLASLKVWTLIHGGSCSK